MANPADRSFDPSQFTPDPLLGSDSFISTDPNQQTQPDPVLGSDSFISTDPNPQTQPDPVLGSDSFISTDPNPQTQPDPVLGSDSFISTDPNPQTQPDPVHTTDAEVTPPPGFAAASDSSHTPVGKESDPKSVPGSDPLLGSGDSIAAEGGSKGPEAKRARKASEDGGETPGWLPAGWTMTCRTRTNGATAGTVDRYYVEPKTGQRFRSKIEVKRYLETGSRKKTNSDANATPSKKTDSKKKKKKKEAAWSFDFENPPEEVTWSLVDEDQGLWKQSIGEEEVPETSSQEWATAFERACQMD